MGQMGRMGLRATMALWLASTTMANVAMAMASDTCGSVIRSEWAPGGGSAATLSSPGYPNSYPDRISCTWFLVFPENTTLTIRLVDMDIEEDANCSSPPCCSHNWLKLSSKQMCGQNIKFPEFTTENKLAVVKFHTSKVTKGGRGFHIIYVACKKDQFHCADNLSCIDPSLKCDGIPHCGDGSDEWKCVDKIYPFECNKKNMVPCGGSDLKCFNNITDRCNGNVDCPITANDETNCVLCGASKLYCKLGGCYPLYGACDNIVHCPGGWDEGVRGGCGVCAKNYVPCGLRDPCHCFNAHTQRCDGQMDCPGGQDETSCVIGCETKIACASVQGCYLPSERCDGVSQCVDNSDEMGCSQSFPAKFKCITTSRCVDDYMVCNGEDECGDGSDEIDCIKNSVITVVVMGSLICGILAVLGVAIGWRYYSFRNRPNVIGNPNAYQRQENAEPLDDSSLYHMYREPPPTYQEAIMQGASPPMYWHPTRFMDMSVHGDSTPPVALPRRQRPRSSTTRPRSARVTPKPNQIKPVTETYNTACSGSEVIAGDQLYPENSGLSDSDTPMLELSDNNMGTSGTDNFTTDSNASSPSAASCTNLIVTDSHSDNQDT